MEHCDQEAPPLALTVAGTDPSGGAGIPVDLQVFRDFGLHGLSVVSAVVSQNTSEIRGFEAISAVQVVDQWDAVVDDMSVDAVKIGMLASPSTAEMLAERLGRLADGVTVVLDPVLAGGGDGARLHEPRFVRVLRDDLLPAVDWVTPNRAEAEALLGETLEGRAALRDAAESLHQIADSRVLLKGGHVDTEGDRVVDALATENGSTMLEPYPRVPVDVHGTGCQLSAALAALSVTEGRSRELADRARGYLAELIQHRCRRIGRGRPVVVRDGSHSDPK